MSPGAARDHDPVHIAELFAAFGPVSVRRMFGGAGIFADGIMFALVDRGAIYLKADEGSIAAFKREGLGPFKYSAKGGKRVVMSYWRMPERLYDDPDDLARWAAQAFEVARGKAAKRSPKSKTMGRKSKS